MMPKLKVRPTQAQARLLLTLHDNPGLRVTTRGAYIGSAGRNRPDNVLVSVVRSCIREGWLVEGVLGSYSLDENGVEWVERIMEENAD